MNSEHTLKSMFDKHDEADARIKLQLYINLKLAASGQPICSTGKDAEFMTIAHDLIESYREKSRLLSFYLCPADQRIQSFLNEYLADLDLPKIPRLPTTTFVLDRYGVARELSLPLDSDEFISDIVHSYRVQQGVLHNPKCDRRTTANSFHIVERGLPIPGDKKAVSKRTFALLLDAALNPPDELLRVPFTLGETTPAELFVSLLLRPIVCPEIPGKEHQKNMEIRFFAPGCLVSNLDFVESIFGNAGNPYLPENDAGLDVNHWTGHSGCVILAPHVVNLTKKELGLPHYDDASLRQRADAMCWQDEDELYNQGNPFKITARDESGVIITIVADSYFGYCKKEVKTQISYSANLFGLAEEEHAGGAWAFPCFNHGDEFVAESYQRNSKYSFAEVCRLYGDLIDIKPEGYGIDKKYPNIVYVPLDLRVDLNAQAISWEQAGIVQTIKLRPEKIYVLPTGYKVEMLKHKGAPSWRLVGTDAVGVFCHKPCTVSGGGKSEISKSLDDSIIYGSLFVKDLKSDLDYVEDIFNCDYSDRFMPDFVHEDRDPLRKPLNARRSLGSFIRLLTPSSSHTQEYKQWLAAIPEHIRALAFIIKRFHNPEWGENWRQHFSVDVVNGTAGYELKIDNRKLVASYVRVGREANGSWRIYKLRQDFIAAEKIQMEDDISASVVVPQTMIKDFLPAIKNPCVKLVENCEYRLFQRPDDAIHRGIDKQTEADLSQSGNFLANYEPLYGNKLAAIVEDIAGLQQFTPPMQTLLTNTYKQQRGYVVSSAHPRIVDGKPSKNPRYLQLRPDLVDPSRRYVAEMGVRLLHLIPLDRSVCVPVDAVLTGRRNNPPQDGIRPLAVYNPIHYQELPELFMDFICSLTGKSPSTTGTGSEGALTKGPFNALLATTDLNNALVSFILSEYAGFSSAAGYIGPNLRVDHDISLLIPEIWARLTESERTPAYLTAEGFLEKVDDFQYHGKTVQASRLGYRITERFIHRFIGKIFDNPNVVFDKSILRPETQDLDCFVQGIENIVDAQRRVAQFYLDDDSVDNACPPLKALLFIMATGEYEGKDVHHPDIRALFNRDAVLASDWYHERLTVKQTKDIALLAKQAEHIETFLELESHAEEAARLNISGRLEMIQEKMKWIESPEYVTNLIGTIGADPM